MLQSQYTQVMSVTKMNNLDLNQTFKTINYKWKVAIAIIFLIVISPAFKVVAFAGEWNEKPVICADQLETFGAMAAQDQVLIAIGKQVTRVKDPDEQNGIAVNPVILPWAIYGNLETGTFTVLEYHAYPYEQFCTIGIGVEFELVPDNLEELIEWQRKRDGMN